MLMTLSELGKGLHFHIYGVGSPNSVMYRLFALLNCARSCSNVDPFEFENVLRPRLIYLAHEYFVMCLC